MCLEKFYLLKNTKEKDFKTVKIITIINWTEWFMQPVFLVNVLQELPLVSSTIYLELKMTNMKYIYIYHSY